MKSRTQSNKFYFVILALIVESGDHQTEESGFLSACRLTIHAPDTFACLVVHAWCIRGGISPQSHDNEQHHSVPLRIGDRQARFQE